MTFKFPQPLVGDGTRLFIQTLQGVTTLYLFGNGSSVVRSATLYYDANQRAKFLAAVAPAVGDGDIYDYFVKFEAEPPFGKDKKRKKNYVVEAFYPMGSSSNACDQERPDKEDNKGGRPGEYFLQPGTGQGNEPVH